MPPLPSSHSRDININILFTPEPCHHTHSQTEVLLPSSVRTCNNNIGDRVETTGTSAGPIRRLQVSLVTNERAPGV